MIQKTADGLLIRGSMLIGNASDLLIAGRYLLRSEFAKGIAACDLSAVGETDSSALSVLFGLLRTANELGIQLQIKNPPASMISQAELYGVSTHLALA